MEKKTDNLSPVCLSWRCKNLAAWVLVLLTLAQLGWLQTRPGSGLRTLLGELRQSSSRQKSVPFSEFDHLAEQAGANNIFIKIAETDTLSARNFSEYQDFSLSLAYYRTCYLLYPRRAYVAPADTVINKGRDMMPSRFEPDLAWLRARDVRSILTLGFDPQGRSLIARWEQITNGAAGNKFQTEGAGGK